MAQNIYYSNLSNEKYGKINIGLPVFNFIVEQTLRDVKGVFIEEQGIFSYNKGPVVSDIVDHQLIITISLKISYGVIASAIAKEIQTKVSSAIHEMTNVMPKYINVNIIGVEF